MFNVNMSKKLLQDFLNALDTVRTDLTCVVCKQLVNSPIIFKNCHHIICKSEYHKDLRKCPECDVKIEILTENTCDSFKKLIESNKMLYDMCKDERIKLSEMVIEETNHKMPEKSTKPKRNKSKCSDVLDTSTASGPIDCNIEKLNTKGETTLHIACHLGQLSKARSLLEMGANTNTKDYAGWTPLHEVVQCGFENLVELLLQYKTLVNVPGHSNETPLHEAVRNKNKTIIKMLIEHGANAHLKNCKGETPMDLADQSIKTLLITPVKNDLEKQALEQTELLHLNKSKKRMRIFCSSQNKEILKKLKKLESHSDLHIESNFNDKVTHFIVDCDDDLICESSNSILQAIVRCIWVISAKWVLDSSVDELKCFKDYEARGVGGPTFKGPSKARYNKYKMLPGLFNSCHLYLHGFRNEFRVTSNLVLNRIFLAELIKEAGGILLRRPPNPESIPEAKKLVPYHASKGELAECSHYIIYNDDFEPKYNMKHLKVLPVGWLIECIEKYELCEPWSEY